MATRQRGKHRSARRPVTPLTVLAENLGAHAGAIGRSTAVVAVGSGLLATAGAMAAQADTPVTHDAPVGAAVVDGAATSPASARALIDAKSIATTPAEADWSAETAGAAAVTVTKPEPVRPAVTTSRSAARSQAPATANNLAELQQSSSFQTNGNAVLEIAKRYVGTPYVWGGASPAGFDCSGFTMYVYAQLGYSLPHSSYAQMSSGRHVSAAEAQPGDLYITPGHVAIYAGGGMIIDAPQTGKTVQFRAMFRTGGTFVRVIG